MTLTAFVFAVLALLLAPGPTNMLMALAGAQHGLRRVGRLLPAELAGYLTTILPLVILGGGLLAQVPMLATALKTAAAAWVLLLAIRLWRVRPGTTAAADTTAAHVWLTTVLNPKAVVIALVLLPPPGDPGLLSRLGLFCLLVAGAALVWGGVGVCLQTRGGSDARLCLLRRAASVWLVLVSASLVGGLLRV